MSDPRRFTDLIRRRVAPRLAMAACLSVTLAAAVPRSPEAAMVDPPTLVVLITVDQLRPDYFDRFRPQLSGGLARLLADGAVFTDAYQDHAITETAPGHAATLSGRFPRGTGIVRNIAGVQDPGTTLIGSRGPGASPMNLRGSTLVDWLLASQPRSRALSVSYKDRGAILPVGHRAREVYWFAEEGFFTTSTYYHDSLPAWVTRFNARREPGSYTGRAWLLLLPTSAYPEPDSVPLEGGGAGFTFPHRLSDDTATAVRTLPATPWMDQVTLDLALAGLRELRLGAGPQTDVLAVSLSATDFIGHQYGPDSREMHDQVLRLDRALGAFLDTLFRIRDSARVVIALTADHGVAPIPELHFAARPNGDPRVSLGDLLHQGQRELSSRGLDPAALGFEAGLVLWKRAAVAAAKAPADSVLAGFIARARRHPGVLRVDRVTDLTRADTVRDAIARRWIHTLPPDLPVAAVVTLRPFYYWGGAAPATHGSPYDYDAHVPLLLYGSGVRPGRYTQFSRVVDLAPTLAWLAHVKPTEPLDGHVLREALK